MDTSSSIFEQIEELRRLAQDAHDTRELMLPRYEYTQQQVIKTKAALELIRDELDGYAGQVTEQQGHINQWEAREKDFLSQVERLERALARSRAEEAARQALLNRELEFDLTTADAPWREKIRHYQLDGAKQMAAITKGLLGDKRGLGKSLTSLAYADMLRANRLLILAPRKTAVNFKKEVMRWTPARRPIYLVGVGKSEAKFILQSIRDAKEALPGFTVILNIESWRRDAELIELLKELRFDTVIVDESHNLKNSKTSAWKGVKQIVSARNKCPECGQDTRLAKVPGAYMHMCMECGHQVENTEAELQTFQSVKNVLLMTGSPIMNRPVEIWPQLHLLDPIGFPTENKFRDDFLRWDAFVNQYRWSWGAEERLVELLGMRYIARTKKDVGDERPDPTESTLEVEFSATTHPTQYERYRQMQEEFEVLLESGETLQAPVVIAQLNRLQGLILWPPGVKIYATEWDHEKQKFRNTNRVIDHVNVYESAIVDAVTEHIRELVEEGSRVVVFSKFVAANREIAKRLNGWPDATVDTGIDQITAYPLADTPIGAAVYDGETSQTDRDMIELDFDIRTCGDDPKWNVLLTTYKAGGESINFTAADTVIMLDGAWNPEIDSQAIGRLDRIGQEKQVNVIRVTTSGNTVYQWIEGLNDFKRDMIGGWEAQVNLAEQVRQQIRKQRGTKNGRQAS